MKRILKNPHLWIILAIMICGGALYYSDQIPLLPDFLTNIQYNVVRYSLYLILFLIPAIYATCVFQFLGGVLIVIVISLALLPRPLFITQSPEDVSVIVTFLIIGLIAAWLIKKQQQTVQNLEKARHELTGYLEKIKTQSQLLGLYADISTLIYKTADVNEITTNALQKVLDITRARAGWIYLLGEGGKLSLNSCNGEVPQFVENARGLKLGEGPDGKAALSGALVVTKNDPSDYSAVPTLGENQITAIVPLLSKGGLQGTLGILTTEQQFSSEQSQMLTGLGIRIGLAVERAMVDQKERSVTEQLRLSEERYRGLFENASEAIFICSGSSRIISVNRAGEEITGYTHDELNGLNMNQLFSGSGQTKIEKIILGKAQITTIGRHEELKLNRKDGTDAFVELRISPVFRESQIIGWQAIARDVTEEKQLHQNMQHYVAQVTKAQEEERLRISRELHDETAQLLAVLSRSLDSVVSDGEKLPESTISVLKKLREITESILKGVRRFSQDLRPSILDDLGLVPALEWLTSDLRQYGITAKVKVIGDQYRFTSEKELVIYRIVQEALSNVRKHSRASQVDMKIDFDKDAVTITIQDDGDGFNIPDRVSDLAKSGKLGLMGMRERARLIGGTLVIKSEINSGTSVILRVPNKV